MIREEQNKQYYQLCATREPGTKTIPRKYFWALLTKPSLALNDTGLKLSKISAVIGDEGYSVKFIKIDLCRDR